MLARFFKIIVFLASSQWSFDGFARARDFLKITPTFALNTRFYLSSTHKSEIAENNDTGSGFSYQLGGYAGKERNLGFFLRNETLSTTFELNSSTSAQTWQDTIIRYRWGYLYLGPMFSTLSYTVNLAGTDTVDSVATGTGGNVGLLFPIGNVGSLTIDVVSVSMAKTVNELTTTTAVGARQDIDLGASIDLTADLIDLVFGYRQQTFAVTTASSYSELVLSTYLGLQFSIYF